MGTSEQLALPLRGGEAGASGRVPAPWQRAVNGENTADPGQERGPPPHLHGRKGAATQASHSLLPWEWLLGLPTLATVAMVTNPLIISCSCQ